MEGLRWENRRQCLTQNDPDDFVITDLNGRLLADCGSGLSIGRRCIFDYVNSAKDLERLQDAMARAVHAEPQAVDLTFRFIGKKFPCHCHIYKGPDKYLISGWQIPDNIRNLYNCTPAASSD